MLVVVVGSSGEEVSFSCLYEAREELGECGGIGEEVGVQLWHMGEGQQGPPRIVVSIIESGMWAVLMNAAVSPGVAAAVVDLAASR